MELPKFSEPRNFYDKNVDPNEKRFRMLNTPGNVRMPDNIIDYAHCFAEDVYKKQISDENLQRLSELYYSETFKTKGYQTTNNSKIPNIHQPYLADNIQPLYNPSIQQLCDNYVDRKITEYKQKLQNQNIQQQLRTDTLYIVYNPVPIPSHFYTQPTQIYPYIIHPTEIKYDLFYFDKTSSQPNTNTPMFSLQTIMSNVKQLYRNFLNKDENKNKNLDELYDQFTNTYYYIKDGAQKFESILLRYYEHNHNLEKVVMNVQYKLIEKCVASGLPIIYMYDKNTPYYIACLLEHLNELTPITYLQMHFPLIIDSTTTKTTTH